MARASRYRGRRPYVVDTNVPVTANGSDPSISFECQNACVQKLYAITREGAVVIDDGDEIFSEYRRYLNLSGEPGMGDRFVKWAYQNIGKGDLVIRVAIPKRTDGSGEYGHFPNDPDLARFDRSDRKFVALARAHGGSPPILNAMDSDWFHAQSALRRHGVRVECLCPERFGAEQAAPP